MKKCWPGCSRYVLLMGTCKRNLKSPRRKKLTPITEGLTGHDSMPPHARIPNICSVKEIFDSVDSWRFRESTIMPVYLLLFSYRKWWTPTVNTIIIIFVASACLLPGAVPQLYRVALKMKYTRSPLQYTFNKLHWQSAKVSSKPVWLHLPFPFPWPMSIS